MPGSRPLGVGHRRTGSEGIEPAHRRVQRVFIIDALVTVLLAFGYPLYFMTTQGVWKTVRHDYSSPYPALSLHATLGLALLVLFVVQFVLATTGVRLRSALRRILHALIGRVYLFALALVFTGLSIHIALDNEIGFDPVSVVLITIAVAWFLTYTALGYLRIRQRDVPAHQDLMVLSLVLISIAAEVRVVLYVNAIFTLEMAGPTYRGLTVGLVLGKMLLYAWLRGVVREHGLLLGLTVASLVLPMLLMG